MNRRAQGVLLVGGLLAGSLVVATVALCCSASAAVAQRTDQPDRKAAALGLLVLRGEGMPKDLDAARAYLARAEELGFDVDAYLEQNKLARP